MARIRSVKPDFFRSPKICALPYEARWLFQGMWTESDDPNGVMPCSTRQLAGLFFAHDRKATDRKIEGWVQRLARDRLLILYEVDGVRYAAVRGWNEHQRIDKPQPAKYPPPPPEALVDVEGLDSTIDSGTTSKNDSTNHSQTDSGRIGKEGKGVTQGQDPDLTPTDQEHGLQSGDPPPALGDVDLDEPLTDEESDAVKVLVGHGLSEPGAIETVRILTPAGALRKYENQEAS